MGIEGPANTKTADKKANTKAPKDMDPKEVPQGDTTSSIGDKNVEGIQGRTGTETKTDVEEDKPPFVR